MHKPKNLAFALKKGYTELMQDYTITTDSAVGRRLEKISENEAVSYLVFKNNKIHLVAQITIGRSSENDVVVDNKLASRQHAVIQKIKDSYFLKDRDSTNGTFLNGERIPGGKYVKLNRGDKVTIGNDSIIFS